MRQGGTKRTDSFKDKKLLAVTIVAFFVFAFFVGFINVGEANIAVTGQQTFISDLFTDWSAGNLDVNIAKYLLWIMVTLLIFSILSAVRFPDNFFLRFLIAIPTGFLSVAYIAPKEVFSIINTYTGLGITLSVIFPFLIILFTSAMLLSIEKVKKMSAGKVIAEIFLWVFFSAVLIWKLIRGLVTGESSFGLSFIILGLVLLVSLGILFFNTAFREWFVKIGRWVGRKTAESDREAREEEHRAGVAAEDRE